jgi:hypothetical protein
MKIFNNIISLIIINGIGYYGALWLLALLILKLDVLNYSQTGIDKSFFEHTYFLRTIPSWAVCSIFSVLGLTFKTNWRYAFMLTPIYVPLIIGILCIITAA